MSQSSSVHGGMRLPDGTCCPRCRSSLDFLDDRLLCTASDCGLQFPVVDGIPVLIDGAQSQLDAGDVAEMLRATTPTAPGLKGRLRALVPGISRNVRAEKNYERLRAELSGLGPAPRVLVLGGGEVGAGMASFLASPEIEFVETDVVPGPRATLLCDAHAVPFEDGSFDGVVIQAVICYLVDPEKAVAEIHRVLKEGGLVYADTPFIQQVTGGAYDYVRYTHLGHRRLFRHFAEVDSGAVCGPGMALAWSFKYFLLSFADSRFWRSLLNALGNYLTFWLPYLDEILVGRPAALDAASGVYLIGRKSGEVLPDKELPKLYRGGMR